VTDFLYSGGDRFTMLTNEPPLLPPDISKTFVDIVIRIMNSTEFISPTEDGRIISVP